MAVESMQDIKRRIKSVTSTEHITNAMKLVSAGKLRKAKAQFERTGANSKRITDTIYEILKKGESLPDKYITNEGDENRTCYIVITSSRGLCGGYNSNIIKETQAHINESGKSLSPYIYAIGSRGRDFFQKRGFDILGDYVEAPESMTFAQAQEICDPIIKMFEEGQIDEVELIHTKFKSSLEQTVTRVTLLPFSVESKDESVIMSEEVEYGPNVGEVFNYLVPKYIEMMVHAAVVESATCEHAARRMAMENATDNAREMLDSLSLTYNRARQAAITDEIIEIVAGSEAQK